MTRIKTLHITNSYHASSGGIRTFYRALLAAADRHQRFVRLVVPAERDSVEEVGDYGRIYHVAAPQSPILDSRYRLMLPHTYAWPYKSRLRKIIRQEQPDLVEVCDKFMLCYLSGVLRRGWIRDVPVPAMVGLSCERLDDSMAAFVSNSMAAESLTRFYMRRLYVPRFDFHIAASEYIAGEIRRAITPVLEDRIYVAPMGVDFEWFSNAPPSRHLRSDLLQRLGAPANSILLLYAGRLSREKNLSLLPEMLKRLAQDQSLDFRLVIAGSGPLEDELQRTLEQSTPGRTLFLGHQQRDALGKLFHAADVFVHPNPREPFGIVPLEAMSTRLPVLAPASGGVLTYANAENAWIAEANGRSFAEAVLDMIQNSSERLRRIENAYCTAARYCWQNVTPQYFHLYDRLHERYVREQLRESHTAPVRSWYRGTA